MCGIAGFVDRNPSNFENVKSTLRAMGDALQHRGPDSSGIWVNAERGIAMVHRRLAIVDLSDAGAQPMTSPSGRYVLVFNGEIYNHFDLRKDLEAKGLVSAWKGRSDTETLLACIDSYGLEKSLRIASGMFALAVYDCVEDCVCLARDRAGEKPLYYGQNGGRYYFASELKALIADPGFSASIDRDALCLFMRHNYIPAPFSIYRGIRKLQPGTFVRLQRDMDPIPYWSANDLVSNPQERIFEGDDQAILKKLDQLLLTSVQQQMQADVPMGAFLSGGIDSSLIVAMMQEQSHQRIRTFSIGFEEEQFNEAPYAKAVARHIGTNHTEMYVTSRQALDVIPNLPTLFDEPFADSSQIPTYLVSKLARQHVTVSLSGDAGDELFGGYNRYTWGVKIWDCLKLFPQPLRQAVAKMLTLLPPPLWDIILSPLLRVTPHRYRYMNPGDKLHKLAATILSSSSIDLYLRLISHWKAPSAVVLGGQEPWHIRDLGNDLASSMSFPNTMMFLDTMTYLPDDILVKVDRASMGVSLETRVPFLNHEVMSAAWSLPQNMKIRNGEGKWCLRQLLSKRVPTALTDRPKSGFGVPLGRWLRNDLLDWAEALLDESSLRQSGYFDPTPIRKKWEQHKSGTHNWQYHIWDVLMFEAWRREVKR